MLTVVALGPALLPGLALSYDMSPVPDPSFSWDQLGLGHQLPRAVPLDAVTTALVLAVPAGIVQKVALVGSLVAAGWGAARLVDSVPLGGRLVAVTVAVWNPYVAERLVLGHWGLLVAYGALPWLVRLLIVDPAGSTPARVLALAACALTPSGGVLSLVVLAVAWGFSAPEVRRGLALSSLAWVLLNAAWWLPGVLRGADTVVGDESVRLFAARGELPGGVLPTVLGLGGIWNSAAVPDSRTTPLAVAALLLVLGVAAAGVPAALRTSRRTTVALVVLAALGVLLGLLGAVPGTRDALGWLVTTLPGAGLLRDGQKYVALLVPLTAVLTAHGADALARRAGPAARGAVLVGAALLPVALLPDLAWGASGRLEAVTYPAGWAQVRQAVDAERADGDLLLLPWSAFRAYGWNDGRTVLDPARRAFPREVLGDDRLAVGSTVLAAEDARGARVLRALRQDRLTADLLRAVGVRLVLVQPGQPGLSARPTGAVSLVRRPGLHLLRVPGDVTPWPRQVGPAGRAAVVVVDLAAAVAVLAALVAPLLTRVRRPSRRGSR